MELNEEAADGGAGDAGGGDDAAQGGEDAGGVVGGKLGEDSEFVQGGVSRKMGGGEVVNSTGDPGGIELHRSRCGEGAAGTLPPAGAFLQLVEMREVAGHENKWFRDLSVFPYIPGGGTILAKEAAGWFVCGMSEAQMIEAIGRKLRAQAAEIKRLEARVMSLEEELLRRRRAGVPAVVPGRGINRGF